MKRLLVLFVAVMVLFLGFGYEAHADYDGPEVGGVTGSGGEEDGRDGGDGGHPWGGEERIPTSTIVKERSVASLILTANPLFDWLLRPFLTPKEENSPYRPTYRRTTFNDRGCVHRRIIGHSPDGSFGVRKER
jgi:hypothetical protein